MATIHLVLQGKGGVGKSLAASLLTQHHLNCEIVTICFDTDPVNKTFAGYKTYTVKIIDILKDGNMNEREFDRLIELLTNAPENSAVIIDNGASTFIPLCAYIKENDVVAYLEGLGHKVMFHSIVTGGQAIVDTMNGLEALVKNFPETPVTVWKNEFFGKVEMNGKTFEETNLYNENIHRIHAIITLEEMRKETFGRDFGQMLKLRLTFAEALADPSFSIMSRQRLTILWKRINEQIQKANL